MSQKPNQHCQEEYYINRENPKSIGEGLVCMYRDTTIHDRAVCPSDLCNLQSGHAIKARTQVNLTVTTPSQVQIRDMRY